MHQTGGEPAYNCGGCGIWRREVHSWRERRVRDLPWGTWPVWLVVDVHRLRCRGCEEIHRPESYLARLVLLLRARHVECFVVAAGDLRDRPRVLLGEGEAPQGLQRVPTQHDVVVWRVFPAELSDSR